MTELKFRTEIKASAQVVFDLARSVDAHLESTSKTSEKVIAGKLSGAMEIGETATWKALHFGFWLTHESLISQMARPNSFTDIMVKGHFKSFEHRHFFEETDGFCVMTDEIRYETPFGIFGKLFDVLALKSHLTDLIANRNEILKRLAERRNQNKS